MHERASYIGSYIPTGLATQIPKHIKSIKHYINIKENLENYRSRKNQKKKKIHPSLFAFRVVSLNQGDIY